MKVIISFAVDVDTPQVADAERLVRAAVDSQGMEAVYDESTTYTATAVEA